MKHDFLQQAFTAANHIPHITDYLHGANLHFRENGMDITVKPPTKRFLGLVAKLKF